MAIESPDITVGLEGVGETVCHSFTFTGQRSRCGAVPRAEQAQHTPRRYLTPEEVAMPYCAWCGLLKCPACRSVARQEVGL